MRGLAKLCLTCAFQVRSLSESVCLTLLVHTLFKYWFGLLGRSTLFLINNLPCEINAVHTAMTFSMTTCSGAQRPWAYLPHRTWKICTGPDVCRSEVFVTVVRVNLSIILALHCSPSPSRTTAFGTLWPLSHYPLWNTKRMDQVDGCLSCFWFTERGAFGDKECIFDFCWGCLPSGGQELDGDGFIELAKALDPF